MATRCNVIVKDSCSEFVLYRHSDGYPSGTLPTLRMFLDRVADGSIRDNVEQAVGWLIFISHAEYFAGSSFKDAWKVGAYKPSIGIHGDIKYLYEIDLDKKSIECWHHNGRKKLGQVDLTSSNPDA